MQAPELKRWELLPPAPPGAVEGRDIPPPIAHVLYHRGLTTSHAIEAFLNPTSASLHDPSLLPGMNQALSRLERAIKAKEIIGILGDFDVDGVSGTALLASGLEQLGAPVVPYLPHRVHEGHGPNAGAIKTLVDQGCSVMITVDCGVTAIDEVNLAQDMGMDTIITDHHTPLSRLPQATSIINPKLPDSRYPFQGLSGAGLAFKLIQGLYNQAGQPWDPDLMCMAAFGTVADVSPLVAENRYLVKAGLEQLASTRNLGLLALCRRVGINPKGADVEAISFAIAPRLNAAGRMDHALTSYRLLTTHSHDEASLLTEQLEHLNQQRRRLTDEALVATRQEVLARAPIPPILLVGQSWFEPGIVGLTASQLVEEFHRPAVVMCLGEDTIRASARSIPEFNMIAALTRCQDLFLRFGGHPRAAGFIMKRENLETLTERLEDIAAQELNQQDLRPRLLIDAEVSASGLAGQLYGWWRALAPFGEANPSPTFLTRGLRPVEVRQMGERGQHLRLKLKEGNAVFDAVAFRLMNGWIKSSSAVDVVYTLGTERRGTTEVMSLRIMDLRPSSSST